MRGVFLALLIVSVCCQSMALGFGNRTVKQRTKPVMRQNLTKTAKAKLALQLKPQLDSEPTGKTPQAAVAGHMLQGKSKHIIKGVLSYRGQFPWQAAIEIDDQNFCGGSIITTSTILTAAHCAEGALAMTVTLGAQNVDTFESNRQFMTSRKFRKHPSWDSDSLQNDLAIVFLPRTVTFTTLVRPVRLPRRSQASQAILGKDVQISGWGRTNDASSSMSSVLYYANMRVVSLVDCYDVYGGSNIFKTNVCAQGTRDMATCQGDSGGPLVMKESDGLWTQVGIVSFGASDGCGKGFPDVFTRVASYLGWISSITGVAIRP